MTEVDAERNLLFGILALQNGLIEQADLTAAFQSWSKDKSRPLSRILVERGNLSEEDRALLERLARRHVEKHGGDPGKSLVAVGATDTVTAVRGQITDPLLEFKLDSLTIREGASTTVGRREADAADIPIDTDITVPWFVEDETSARSRFRILRPHGGGGLGMVSVAMDTELNREVALKEIRPELADDPQSRARFLLEAEVTGQLEHPGVVPVYGLETDRRGRPYYAMRFVRGEDLKEVITQFHRPGTPSGHTPSARALGLRRLLTRFVAVCEVMSYAHDRGVIHRDLKPSNILLGPYGETMVVDWGLAKVLRPGGAPSPGQAEAPPSPTSAISSGSSATLAGAVVGSPAYMSPEQAEGWAEGVGPASDVYSLGATLYTLLVGRPPFSGADIASVLRRVRQGDFPPPRSVNPAVPPALEAVCLRAMSLRPEGRHASARLLAEDLEHWMADEPIPWLVEPWGQRLSRWGRRNRVLVRTGGAALVVVALVSLAAALLINASRVKERMQRIEANTQRARAEDQRRRVEERSLEVQRMSAQIVLDEGLAMCEQGDGARGMLRLARSLELLPPGSPVLERQIRTNLAGWGERLFPLRAQLSTRGKVRAAFSPDGTRVATASDDHTARVWDAVTGRPVTPPLEHGHEVNRVVFSRDGTRIASAANDSRGRIWDATTGRLTAPPLEHGGSASFSPDGRYLLTASYDGMVRIWDPATGMPWKEPFRHNHNRVVNHAAFSPDGARIVTAGGDRKVRIWDVATGLVLGSPIEHGGVVRSAVFSPDGTRIVTACSDFKAQVRDVATGRALGPPLVHNSECWWATFSPDGTRVATASQENFARVWDAATGRPLGPRPEHRGFIHTILFSHDGTRLLTASDDQTARLWDATTGRPLGPPIEHDDAVLWAAFSPDGSRIVTASGDRTARVWDLPRPIDLDPQRIVSSVQSRTGLALDDHGGTVILESPSWEATRRLQSSGSSKDHRPDSRKTLGLDPRTGIR